VTVIEDAAQLIRTRLNDLATERDKLERALSELGGGSVGSPGPTKRRLGRPKGSGNAGGRPRGSGRKQERKSKGKQVPRSEREQAILAFLKDHPSASAKEIGTSVGTTANYINNIFTGLRKQGRLVRKADGTQVEVKAVASSPVVASPAAAKSGTRKRSSGKKRGSGKRRSSKRPAKKSASKVPTKAATGK
jgi:hypothetical protein